MTIASAILCVWRSGLLLLLSCFFAGFVDSIGGGGGLISVPALLTAGVPAPFLLGTNKSISSTGSSVAVARYARAGLLPAMGYVRWTLLIGIAIAGGAAGAVISQLSVILVRFRLLIPVLLVSVMIFLVRKWFFEGRNERVSNTTGTLPRSHPHSAIVGLIAGYDGLFGPGTGTFFLSWLEGLGHPTVEANAMTKVFNLSSNIGALAFFALRGKVIWPVGLACAAAIMMGNFVGSSLVLKRGKNIVRGTVLLVTSALLVRYFISF